MNLFKAVLISVLAVIIIDKAWQYADLRFVKRNEPNTTQAEADESVSLPPDQAELKLTRQVLAQTRKKELTG